MIVSTRLLARHHIGSCQFQPYPGLSRIFIENRPEFLNRAAYIACFNGDISGQKPLLHIEFGNLSQGIDQRQSRLIVFLLNKRFRLGQELIGCHAKVTPTCAIAARLHLGRDFCKGIGRNGKRRCRVRLTEADHGYAGYSCGLDQNGSIRHAVL